MPEVIPFWRRPWLYIYASAVLLFLIAPLLIVIPMSFSSSEFLQFPPAGLSLRWYEEFFSSSEWARAAGRSLQAAVLTAVVSVPVGVAAAYGIHNSRSCYAQTIKGALMTPMIAPVIVVAIGIYYLYAGMGLVNSLLGLVLAHTVLSIPFVLLTSLAGLERFDSSQEMVARTLGATRFTAFRTVTLPQIKPFVLASGLFAFVTSFDEVVVALFISRGSSSTLPRKMFTSLRDELNPTISAISTLLIGLSLCVALLAAFYVWRGDKRAARPS